MKIQLIHPPSDSCYQKCEAEYLQAPPAGLELLAESIKSVMPEAIIEIFDGNFMDISEIKSKIYANFVGVSSWYSKHRNALKILEYAKRINPSCKTVIGGPNASHLASQILANHQFVDYVIVGDGEEAMSGLISDTNLEEIPNLYYRKGGIIKNTFYRKSIMDKLINLDHLVRNEYVYSDNKPFPVSFIRGCLKAVKHGRCIFCSIPYKGLNVMNTDVAWKQIKILQEKYGLDYFFETGDSFIPSYYQKLVETRPDNLCETKFRIYASPEQINNGSIKILSDMHIKEVFLGIETPNNVCLRRAGKFYTKKDVLNALSLLQKHKIMAQTPFMYGLPGETKETAEETYRFAKYVVGRFPNIYAVLASLPIPLVGSRLFNKLKLCPEIVKNYDGDLDNDDIFNYEQLTRLMITNFTSCLFEILDKYVIKTLGLVTENSRSGRFGLTK